ncbi:DUF945 family protein [Acinetobacter boissieri]|uniref:DUF945 domain-containing protein n=1 Tax=Acinetobacter boissieri TaxID=1219383 RepID=A0A1G6GSA1_9GAMM|nr:DUF945 family protein [Acinetobacter boissieri]SDB84799.1 protein of unknown function [Acinetobacter boissieri]
MSVSHKKKIIVVVAIGVAGCSVFGASIYADKELKAMYSADQAYANNIKSKKVNFNMGLFSGDVSWEAEIFADPCKQERSVVIKGTDHVTRGLTGYDIQSKIDVENDEIKRLFDNKPVVTLDAHMSWLGQIDVKLNSPSIIKNKDKYQIDWAGLNVAFKAKKQDGDVYYKDFVLNVPKLHVKENENLKELTIKNIVYKSDHGFMKKIIPNTSEITIDAIQTDFNQKIDVNLIKYKFETFDQNDKLSAVQAFSVGNATFGPYQLNKLVFNSQIQNVAKVEAQNAFSEINELQKQCLPAQEKMTKIAKAVSLVLEKGLKFNSKENVIEVNHQKLNFHVDGMLNAGKYSATWPDIAYTIPQKVTFTYGMEVDKGLIQLLRPELTENNMKDMANMYQGKLTDHSLQFTGKFENGKLN